MRRLLCVLAALLLLGVNFSEGMRLGMAHAIPDARSRQVFYVAAAISSVVYGINGYLSNDLVQNTLVDSGMGEPKDESEVSMIAHMTDAKALKAAITAAKFLPKDRVEHAHNSILINDDIGYIQFLEWAYRLFGVKMAAAYDGYFLILGISVLVFFLFPVCSEFYALGLTSIFLLAQLAFMPAMASSYELLSVTNARFFDILAILPLIYVTCAIFGERRLLSPATIGIVVQSCILSFVPFVRLSSLWAHLFLCLLTAISILYWLVSRKLHRADSKHLRRRQNAAAFLRSAVLISAVVFSGTAGVRAWASHASAPEYAREDVAGYHTIWHNAFTGLEMPGWNERFACIYGGGLGDYVGFSAAERQLRQDGIPDSLWRLHNGIAPEYFNLAERKVFLNFVESHPWFALKVYLYYRPLQIAGLHAHDWALGVRDDILSYIPLVTITGLAGLYLATETSIGIAVPAAIVGVVIWILSTVPDFVSGAGSHALTATPILTICLFYFGLLVVATATAAGIRAAWRSFHPRPFSPESEAVGVGALHRRYELGAIVFLIVALVPALAFIRTAPAFVPRPSGWALADARLDVTSNKGADTRALPHVASTPMPVPPAGDRVAGRGAVPASIDASSSLSPRHDERNLFDGQDKTYWQIGAGARPEEWVLVDLGAARMADVRVLRIKPRVDGPREFFQYAILAGSNDAHTWRSLAKLTVAPYPLVNSDWLGWKLPAGQAYRYYKLTIPQTGVFQFCSLGKLEMYE